MSTPRRRPSPAVYRRRRLVAVLLLLLLVAAVVLAIWQPWRAAAAEAGRTPGPSPSVSSPTVPAPTMQTPTESPTDAAPGDEETGEDATGDDATGDAEPAPDTTATPIPACTTGDISVLAVTDKEVYGSGELPQLTITLSNASDEPCLINVGTARQSFVVTSGSDTWWRSTDCQTESSDQVVQLAAGQTVSSVTPLAWDRTRSSTETCDSTSRPQAPAGYFHLQVSIGGIVGADTRVFQLR